MVDKLTVLTWIHVTFAVIWLGGGLALVILQFRAGRAEDWGKVLMLGQEIEWVGTRIFTPASLIVLAAGIWLTASFYEFSDLWISRGLAGWFISFCTGFFFLGPQSGKLAKLIEERGPTDDAVLALVRRLLVVARFDMVLLYAIVAVMVFKPT